jgi:hypothetical protein
VARVGGHGLVRRLAGGPGPVDLLDVTQVQVLGVIATAANPSAPARLLLFRACGIPSSEEKPCMNRAKMHIVEESGLGDPDCRCGRWAIEPPKPPKLPLTGPGHYIHLHDSA